MLIRKIVLSCLAAVLAMSVLAERADAFYSSAKGRFISRDPIEERGGLNLYGFVGNGPLNGVDPHGMKTVTVDRFEFPITVANVVGIEDCALPGTPAHANILAAANDACDCISKAYIIASHYWIWNRAVMNCPNTMPYARWTKDSMQGANSTVLEVKRMKFASYLKKMMEGCRDGFTLKCECDCDTGDYAYVRGRRSTIHLCHKFYTQNERGRSVTMIHELGHIHTALEDANNRNNNLGSVDSMFEDADDFAKSVKSACDNFERCTKPLP